MNIYIKTFNRPFYLDRCIRSIRFNIRDYEHIIVLEDGTLEKYQEKIHKKYPDVIFRRSNADDDKFRLLKEEKFAEIEKKYIQPWQFWFDEISKEKSRYFFLLEDDTWIVRQLDLARIEKNMAENNCLILQTWWAPNAGEIIPFKQYQTSDGNQIQYFHPDIRDVNSLYQIWLLCMAIYDRNYYLNNSRNLKRTWDEHTQLLQALDYMKNNPQATFARTLEKTTYQGWATPGRATPEYYDMGLRFHLYMECLNEAWYRDELDVTEGYPCDFSYEYILSFLEKALPSQSLDAWKLWRAKEVVFNYD